ncbi:hypothetical protein AGMMS50256_28140 [Betaproteobacteria bacterium]|nr:hypothetical protein AGMMS50256_28140 [Betaproteobacteria bacterium]
MGFSPTAALAEVRTFKLARATETRNTCLHCSVTCGLLLYSVGDSSQNVYSRIIHIEGDPDNLVNQGGADRLAHDVLDAEPSSVLLVTNFDRFPTSVLAVMKHFSELGTETILLTNCRSNPLLRYAKHSLFIHSESKTLFKSRCAMLVMLEALVSGMGVRLHEENTSRLDAMESLFRELGIYLQKN